MKKLLISVMLFSGFVMSTQAAPCVTITASLAKGSESAQVLALQHFLVSKGYLKATPNGYFGPATMSAVKLYQKQAGLAQVGNIGPATRAALAKEQCAGSVPKAVPVSTPATTTPVAQPAVQAPSVSYPRPKVSALDPVSLFQGGKTDWTFNMYGVNFSSSTNNVLVKIKNSNKIYTIGTFSSSDGKTITLPKDFGNTEFSCGAGCKEKLPVGGYDIFVRNEGGESESGHIEIRPFSISSQTGVMTQSLPVSGSNIYFGKVNVSSSQALLITSVRMTVATSSVSSGAISSPVFKDAFTKVAVPAAIELAPYETKIIEAYVSLANTQGTGTAEAYFTVEIEDYIGKKRTTFTSPTFLVTIDGLR